MPIATSSSFCVLVISFGVSFIDTALRAYSTIVPVVEQLAQRAYRDLSIETYWQLSHCSSSIGSTGTLYSTVLFKYPALFEYPVPFAMTSIRRLPS
jgi:hypothetical protein